MTVVGPVILLLAVVLVATVIATARRTGSLSRVERRGDTVVGHVDAPVWLCFRRTLVAPLTSVTAVRPVPPGSRLRLQIRVCGTGWPGMGLGYFWSRRRGMCFVVRRRSREAVEIELGTGRLRQWILEVDSADAVVRELTLAARA
jgi:hypothetical protein